MALNQITYTDKVENSGATDDGKVLAVDMNEIKSVTNGAIDFIENDTATLEELSDAVGHSRWARVSSGGSTPVLDESTGITSVVRTSAGEYTVNLTTAVASKSKVLLKIIPISSTAIGRAYTYSLSGTASALQFKSISSTTGSFIDTSSFTIVIEEIA